MKSLLNKPMLGTLLGVFFTCSVLAQEQDKDPGVKVKMTREVDGEEQTFEKTYASEEEMRNDSEFQQFLEDNGMTKLRFFDEEDEVFHLNKDFGDRFFFNLEDENLAFGFLENDSSGQFLEFNSRELEDHMREMEIRIREHAKDFNRDGAITFNFDNDAFTMISPKEDEVLGAGDDREIVAMEKLEISDDMAGLGKKALVKPKEQLSLENLDYFPNPAPEGIFRLRFDAPKPGELSVKVYNETGKAVYSRYFESHEGRFSEKMDLSQQQKGNYLLEIRLDDKRLTRKIAIEE